MLPKRLDRKSVYESQWINLYVDRVLMPSGKIIEKYHQLDYPKDAVSAMIFNSRSEILFIKSLRYTTQKIEWEIPAGGVENGENILTAAEREVFEETGLKVDELKLCHTYNPANGMSNQKVHIVFGRVKDDKQLEFDTDEVHEVVWLSQDKARQLIAKNEISDGISILPLLMYLSGIIEY